MTARFVLLLAAASLCGCAAGDDPNGVDGSSETTGAGGGDASGAGGAGAGGPSFGGNGPVCNDWQLHTYLPGPDGRLGTDDDLLGGGRTTQEVDDANVIVRSVQYSGPGPDGAWDTADDVVIGELLTLPGPSADERYQVSFDGPGPDGIWGTEDGHIGTAAWAKADANGRPIDQRSLYGAGADGQWLTADDPIGRRHTYSYGDGKIEPKLVDLESVSAGSDMIWGTADDPFALSTRRFDEWGAFADAPGADAAWGTGDDDAYSRYEDKRDWQGYKQYVALFDAGPDLEVFTADDVQTSLATSKCEDDAVDVRLMANAGVDAVWGTADDDVQARMRVTGCGDPCGSATPTSPVDPPK